MELFLDSVNFEEIEEAINDAQPIPQVALKILRIMGEESYDIMEIADAVRQDQVISARTLKVCNSAFFAWSRKIDSLGHALALLGRDTLSSR